MKNQLLKVALLYVALHVLTACGDDRKRVDSLNARALVHLNEGRTRDAIVLLDSAIALQPQHAGSYKNRGNAYRRDGDIDAAIRDYSTAISLDGTDGRFFNDRGFAYLRQHKYQPAIHDFDSALVLNPSHALAQQNRGRTHFYVGNLEQAATDLEKALVRDSTNIYVAIWLHIIRGRLQRPNDAEFAAQVARMDTVTWPGPVARFYMRHITADELHRLSAGTDSTTTTDQTCAWHFYMGEDQLIRGDTAPAVGNLEQAKALCPERFSEYYGAVAELGRIRPAGR